jgi:hypothetical protein
MAWDRPVIYGIGFVSLLFGLWSMVRIMQMSARQYPTLLTVGFFWDILLLGVLFFAVLMLSVRPIVPWVPIIPEDFLFALLVASVAGIAILNFGILFLGRKFGVIQQETDPVPFRPLVNKWRRRGSNG